MAIQHLDTAAVDGEKIGARLYLNGFPKSGIHMLRNMAMVIASVSKPYNWLSSFEHHCWSTEWVDLDKIFTTIKLLPEGFFLKGHMGYRDDLATAFYEYGWSVVFLYRDLRDVAVSQLYHILSEDDVSFVHPGKAEYRALGSHEEILLAIITGLDEYAGLVERWELYEAWRRVPWVLKLQYETMRADPRATASLLLRYVLERTMNEHGLHAVIADDDHDRAVDRMVELAGDTRLSPTFRRGRVGGWRDCEYFTPRIKQAFLEAGGGDWLMRLGYENDMEWQK